MHHVSVGNLLPAWGLRLPRLVYSLPQKAQLNWAYVWLIWFHFFDKNNNNNLFTLWVIPIPNSRTWCSSPRLGRVEGLHGISLSCCGQGDEGALGGADLAAYGGTPFEFSKSFGLRMLQCVHNPWCVWTENRCCGEGELLTGAFLGFPCCLLAPFYHKNPYVLASWG